MKGITVEKVTVEYTQEADDVSGGIQTLTVTTDDGGAGKYFVISTDRWAFDNLEDLHEIMKDFENRMK